MYAYQAIQKTIEYIEENIGLDIMIEELALIAALSQFYYQRLFTKLVKKPVKEYIKLRKLARSCDVLLSSNKKIYEIASMFGFFNHETFTRAFKNTYAITPKQYRDNPIDLDNFDKPDLLLNHTMVEEGVPLIADGLVLEYNRKIFDKPINFYGIKGYYRFKSGKMLGERPGISEPSIIWNNFFKIQKNIVSIPNGRIIGVSYQGDAEEGYSTYFVGIEADNDFDNKEFNHWVLPKREYLVCSFEAKDYKSLMIAQGKAMKHIRMWLKEHGLRADGFFPEIYSGKPQKRPYMEMWIPFKEREKENI